MKVRIPRHWPSDCLGKAKEKEKNMSSSSEDVFSMANLEKAATRLKATPQNSMPDFMLTYLSKLIALSRKKKVK